MANTRCILKKINNITYLCRVVNGTKKDFISLSELHKIDNILYSKLMLNDRNSEKISKEYRYDCYLFFKSRKEEKKNAKHEKNR